MVGSTEELCLLIRYCDKTLPCFVGSYSTKQSHSYHKKKTVLNSLFNKKGSNSTDKNGTLGCLFSRKIKFRSCQHPNEKHSRVLDSIVVGSHLHSQHCVPLPKVLTKDVSQDLMSYIILISSSKHYPCLKKKKKRYLRSNNFSTSSKQPDK